MSNKINGMEIRPAAPSATAPIARSKDSFGREGAPTGGNNGGVQITDTARHLANLERMLSHSPEVNEAKVTEISVAIERGQFEIQPERIADNLLRLEQTLARASGRMK
jgi:negative regulator of flagellin synthesis FlgM